MTSIRALILAVALATPVAASAATPQAGIEQKVRRGLYTETDLGTFFTVRTAGGSGVSNAQAYLQLGVGYDITEHISVGAQFGLGASAGLCYQDTANSGDCGVTDSAGNIIRPDGVNQLILPDNFANTFFQAHFTYYVPIVDKLVFAPRLLAGYARLDPAPIVDANNDPVSGGPMVGADLAIEYATWMDHFTVGLDVAPRYVIGPNILSFAIFPRVKYTF